MLIIPSEDSHNKFSEHFDRNSLSMIFTSWQNHCHKLPPLEKYGEYMKEYIDYKYGNDIFISTLRGRSESKSNGVNYTGIKIHLYNDRFFYQAPDKIKEKSEYNVKHHSRKGWYSLSENTVS